MMRRRLAGFSVGDIRQKGQAKSAFKAHAVIESLPRMVISG